MSQSSKWFTSSFGSELCTQPSRKRSLNSDSKKPRKRPSIKKRSNVERLLPALPDDFGPRCVEDLAVHPKKIQEVRNWLSCGIERGSGILLMTGPSGSGKSTTLRILAKAMSINIRENENYEEYDIGEDGMDIRELSERECLIRFLSCAQRGRTITLVEYLPPIYYSDPLKLSELLLLCGGVTVFCLSAVPSTWHLCPFRLFSSSTCARFAIDVISFNASAPTYMLRALRSASKYVGIQCTDGDLRRVADSAEGDIRRAMTILRYASIECEQLDMISNKADSLLSLFHMLGRILYAKREETANREWIRNEGRMVDPSKRRPFPPERNMNTVVDDVVQPANDVLLYLLEHEPHFCPSLSSLRQSLDVLSLADSLSCYNNRPLFDQYSLHMAGRSIVYHNYSSVQRKWPKYEFLKPSWKELSAEITTVSQSINAVKTMDFFTDLIPLATAMGRGSRVERYLGRPMTVSWRIGFEDEKNVPAPTVKEDDDFIIEDTDSDF